MKKIIRGFFILLSLLLAGLVAFPWNNTVQWGLDIPLLQEQEIYIKAGIGVLLFLISLIYLIFANYENKKHGKPTRAVIRVALLPLYMYLLAVVVYSGLVLYTVYSADPTPLNLMKTGFFGLVALVLIAYSHIFFAIYRKQCNGYRVALFIFLLINVGVFTYLAFWFRSWGITNTLYSNINSYYYIAIPLGALLGFIVHTIIISIKSRRSQTVSDEDTDFPELEFEDIRNTKKDKSTSSSTIVPENQAILSEQNVDPTNMVYEDVNIDPEFIASQKSNQPNSIEYYIEKPKMFKPLDPSFDQLVAYIRGLPQVVTKLDDDKITFYIDRKPFIVLMNFGNYYRMAFKYDLEKGIRLIIKYPTISKNKSTRDELWFKANNYGDIPKDVIFSIVKTSYDSINL